MKNEIVITCSIVLFKERITDLDKTINSFLNVPFKKKLFLIDNTPDKFFEYVFVHENIEYISVDENIGFGSAHNIVIDKIRDLSAYHLILNPDVYFKFNVIQNLILELQKDNSLAMIAPKVLFPDKKHQYSCRRYPSFAELFARRFISLKPFFKAVIYKGTYRDKNLNNPFFAEYITGCFHLYNTNDFISLKGFDERYFLYMEDVDICRKIDVLGKKKLYYPNEEIIHLLKQGSSKKIRLFFIHFSSIIKYFMKWGFKLS
tara:strand:- start:10428 stop:11207 length:780 start_codon:yes stop_codon:yes gene_type:complete